jgi:hypothetical protein
MGAEAPALAGADRAGMTARSSEADRGAPEHLLPSARAVIPHARVAERNERGAANGALHYVEETWRGQPNQMRITLSVALVLAVALVSWGVTDLWRLVASQLRAR